MYITGTYKARSVLIASILSTAAGCSTANAPVYPEARKPTPHELAERATKLVRELAQLGEAIDAERLSEGSLQVACQCAGPVQPNVVVPVPQPVPPLLETDVLKAIELVAAINAMNVPAMTFKETTVTIGYSVVGR
jgi:hypothetical protein